MHACMHAHYQVSNQAAETVVMGSNRQTLANLCRSMASPRVAYAGGPNGAHDATEADEVLEEHFTRNTQFFGREGQQRVASAFVIVVGLGVCFVPSNLTLPSGQSLSQP